LSNNLFTYLVLERGVSHEQVEKKIPDLLQKYASRELMEAFGITFEEFEKAGNLYTYKLQPLCDIHLNTEIEGGFKPNNSRMYVYIFSLIAIFILVIACINFMNLSTARSANRAKEVGIRKVMGSLPRQLMFQFLFESLVLSFFSLFIALLLVEILMPVFRNFVNLELELNYFSNPYIIPGLVGIALFVGVLAGSYPAFLLSSFKPIAVLKGKLVKGSKSGNLRTVLVVFQFAISIFILLSTTTIYKQLNYLLNKDLGFDREQLLVLPRGEALKKQIPQFKQELLRNPVVLSATNSTSIPGYPNNHNGYQIEGRDPSEAFLLYTTWIDYDFFNTYRIELKEGRFHDLKFTSDSFAVLINEAAVRKFAITDPLNTRFIQPTDRDTTLFRQVIGVVKDFNFQSLHTPIEPAVFMIKPANWEWGGYLTVRLKKNEITESVDFVESKWKDFSQNQPFDYFFFDDRYTEHYKEEKRTGRISTMFSILAIFIACLGLLGLISFAAEQRTKEIGVRKVLGASGYSIIFLLSKEIFVLLGIAIVLASPVAYLIMNKWLENFAYRIDYNMPVFIILVLGAISVSFLIAMLTVLYQAVYATRRNPIEALRYE